MLKDQICGEKNRRCNYSEDEIILKVPTIKDQFKKKKMNFQEYEENTAG